MKISEIFSSYQGEGVLAGTPSIFVRTSVCNLRCVWCDTRYTSWEPEWEEWTLDRIESEVSRLADAAGGPVRHLVMTGGEPTLDPEELVPLCARLSRRGFHITMETNATRFVQVDAHLISMSPKLSNSTPSGSARELVRAHEAIRINAGVIRKFLEAYDDPPRRNCQVKFVIERAEDIPEVREVEQTVGIPRDKILLMPQSIEPADLVEKSKWLRDLAVRSGYGFSPRLHIAQYGNRRGV